MNFKYDLPREITTFINEAELIEIYIGCSDSQVFKILKKEKNYYLKMAKHPTLMQEYNALKWLDGKLPVPSIELFKEYENNDFLVTEEIMGEMICSNYYLNKPELAMDIIGDAFLQIVNVDMTDCPYDVSLDYKLNLVTNNVEKGLVKSENLEKTTLKRFGNIENVLKYLKENKFKEELCFSHGDTSLPNIFAQGNKFSGFIDVGECGIADKWFDISICEKSIKRNFGEEWINNFYEKLNIKRDAFKVEYYLLLMELYL